MARPTLGTHPKFFRLATLLGSRYAARGVLELIWDAAYASGDPNVGVSTFVEAVADWRGKPGELAAALVQSGFLEESASTDANGKQVQTFAVHDLEDHAPSYVLKRWQREADRQAKGETLRSVRQKAAREKWASKHANGSNLQASVPPPASRTRIPHPHPAPAPDPNVIGGRPPIAKPLVIQPVIPDLVSVPSGEVHTPEVPRAPAAPRYPQAFEAVWAGTGKRGGKDAAHRAWVKASRPDWGSIAATWGAYMLSDAPSGGFIQHLSTWLNGKGHLQEWTPGRGRRPAGQHANGHVKATSDKVFVTGRVAV